MIDSPSFNQSLMKPFFWDTKTKLKAYRVLNLHTHVIEEIFDITFDDNLFQNLEPTHVMTLILVSDAPPPGSPNP